MFHRGIALGMCLIAAACAADTTPTTAAPAPATQAAAVTGCGIGGGGYLRARARGAVELDLDWKDSQLECAGGPRPDGKGVRVSFAGPPRGDGRRIRLVFGIGGIGAGAPGKALPTNVTILFEGEKRIFSTQGDDKCTVDSMTQERVGELGGETRHFRVVARGFCVGPATSLSQGERLLLTSFDFAGRIDFEDDAPDGKNPDAH
jgi:hypothetical protein